MNEKSIKILLDIGNGGGAMERSVLYSQHPADKNIISSLATGNRPNIFLDNGVYRLTQRGYDTLLSVNITLQIERNTLTDYVRGEDGSTHRKRRLAKTSNNVTGGTADMVLITIDRNDHITVTAKVHDRFKQWVKANGTEKNLIEQYGNTVGNNWDANDTTNFYDIDFKNIDTEMRGDFRIFGERSGLNPLLVKLACANDNGEYTVKYKGLIPYERLDSDSKKLAANIQAFYVMYVKAISIKISVQFII